VSKRLQVRLRWFDDGALMLRRVLVAQGRADALPETGDFYACPCCLKAYPREAVAARMLTDEHVPPGLLGGRRLVLTCEPCNSGAGHEFDAHAVNRARAEDFMQGKFGEQDFPVTVHADGVPLRGKARWTEAGIQMVGVDEQNDPKQRAAHMAALDAYAESKDPKPTVSFTVHLKPYDDARARYSRIRAAYLAAFAGLGYSYILRNVMKPVRDQLANPDVKSLPTYMYRDPNNPPDARHILLVDDPDELRCVAVIMGEHAVFLPGLFEPLSWESRVGALAERRQDGDRLLVNLNGKGCALAAVGDLLP